MKRTPALLLALWLPLWCIAQAGELAAPAQRMAPPSNLQGAWDRSANADRADHWREANSATPDNAVIQWNWFRSEYDALNSRSNGTLGERDRAELGNIAGLIARTAPNSFEHHLADYYLLFPAARAFDELAAAAAIAPERPELISPMLSKALRNGDAVALKQWGAALDGRGGLAPALKTVARDVLLGVTADAVLFANGDMDVQPLIVALQLGQDKAGVLVVDRRLLADAGYRARTWAQAGGRGAVPDAGPGFARALLESSGRPVYFTLSMDRSWLEAFPGRLHAVGAVFRVGAPSPEDADLLARRWKVMRKPVDAGPLSRNYLLPGAVLLGQLRQSGDLREAARVEADLRRIAAGTGATGTLRQQGILQH